MITVRGESVTMAAELLRKGEVVAIPTETVYGLAANALEEKAVLKIFSTKNRPAFDPLIVHVPGPEQARLYADVNEDAARLMQIFWPGPLTILLPKKEIVPDLVTSGLPTVGLRMPAHPLTLELLASLDFPLAAPSANPFGYISPTTPGHVNDQLGGKIPYILEGGQSRVGVESTIVSPENGRLILHRPGGISMEELEAKGFRVETAASGNKAPQAPGNLDSHYAPAKPLFFGKAETLLSREWAAPVEVICLHRKDLDIPGSYTVHELSASGDLELAAGKLFATMRECDRSASSTILAFEFPEEGLGRAINDRLRRASFV